MSHSGPRREQLLMALRTALLNAQAPGQTLPSERTLAARHGVARETLRRALRELTRLGVIGMRDGRHVVRKPRVETGSVLILTRCDPQRGHRFAPGYDVAVTLAVRDGLDRAGLRPVLLHPDHLAGDGALRVLARPPAALVIAPDVAGHAEAATLAAACASRDLPVVAEAEPALQPHADTVQHDHAAGGEAVTTWLIEHGCRRILPLWRMSGQPQWLSRRAQGYLTAMHTAGLEPLEPVHTGDLPSDNSGDLIHFMTAVRGVAGALPEHLCRTPRIDALLLATDAHAVQAAAALRLFGLHPNRDIILAGYDATWPWERSRRFEPHGPLVTYDKDEAGLAQAIVDRVCARLANPNLPAMNSYRPGRLVPVEEARYAEPYRDPWA
jgi:DNA-binding LacI/PurR family transcriptional regulator